MDCDGILWDMYERDTEPEDRNIYSFLCLLWINLIPEISKDGLWNEYNGADYVQLGDLGMPAPINQYAQDLVA